MPYAVFVMLPVCKMFLSSGGEKHIRRENVQNLLKELYDSVKDRTVNIPCNKWCDMLKEVIRALCERKADELRSMCYNNKIRSIWRFAGILQIVMRECPEACPEELGESRDQ